MNIYALEIPEIKIFTLDIAGDSRGWFSEALNFKALNENGIAFEFFRENHSFTSKISSYFLRL